MPANDTLIDKAACPIQKKHNVIEPKSVQSGIFPERQKGRVA
jgi:hypothetical protein